jgi:hypothetical protein
MRLAQLRGSHFEGTIQIAEIGINDALNGKSTSKRLTVEMLPGNHIAVRYGVFHARAALPAAIAPSDAPHLTLALASMVVAYGLKAMWRQPFVHVHGRRVTIDLAAVPALAAWRDIWRHVRRMTFETAPGALRVGVAVMVAED